MLIFLWIISGIQAGGVKDFLKSGASGKTNICVRGCHLLSILPREWNMAKLPSIIYIFII